MASVPLPAGTGASSPSAATCSSTPLILPSRIALDLSSDDLTGFLIQNPADSSSIPADSSSIPVNSSGLCSLSIAITLSVENPYIVISAAAQLLICYYGSGRVSVHLCTATAWFLFEQASYSFLSSAANVILISVVILFLWAKSAVLLSRPLPRIPNLEISEESVEKAADAGRIWINGVLAFAHYISTERDMKLFFEVVLVLWSVQYIGRLANFLTVVHIGSLACISYGVSLVREGSLVLKESLETRDDFEFEIGVGAVIHQLEASVTQLSVNQSARFITKLPSKDLILVAAGDCA